MEILTYLIPTYNGTSFDAENLSWFARINSTIKLPYNIDWQTRIFYSGPRVTAQSKSKSIFSMSGALNKDILKEKGTISFRASDIFNSSKRITETRTPTFFSYGEFQWRQPTFIVTFTYRLNQKKNQNNRTQMNQGSGEEFDF